MKTKPQPQAITDAFRTYFRDMMPNAQAAMMVSRDTAGMHGRGHLVPYLSQRLRDLEFLYEAVVHLDPSRPNPVIDTETLVGLRPPSYFDGPARWVLERLTDHPETDVYRNAAYIPADNVELIAEMRSNRDWLRAQIFDLPESIRIKLDGKEQLFGSIQSEEQADRVVGEMTLAALELGLQRWNHAIGAGLVSAYGASRRIIDDDLMTALGEDWLDNVIDRGPGSKAVRDDMTAKLLDEAAAVQNARDRTAGISRDGWAKRALAKVARAVRGSEGVQESRKQSAGPPVEHPLALARTFGDNSRRFRTWAASAESAKAHVGEKAEGRTALDQIRDSTSAAAADLADLESWLRGTYEGSTVAVNPTELSGLPPAAVLVGAEVVDTQWAPVLSMLRGARSVKPMSAEAVQASIASSARLAFDSRLRAAGIPENLEVPADLARMLEGKARPKEAAQEAIVVAEEAPEAPEALEGTDAPAGRVRIPLGEIRAARSRRLTEAPQDVVATTGDDAELTPQTSKETPGPVVEM